MKFMKRLSVLLNENRHLFIPLAVFLCLHIWLFNINAAEWGDSYRILRAAKYIRTLSYPEDEKRLPGFPVITATWPEGVDPVFWGRLVMLVFSCGAFWLFLKYFRKASFYAGDKKTEVLAALLFALNPVFFYWSLRIMADVPFAFFVLLAFYLLAVWKSRLSILRGIILGFVAGASALIRFEGFLLFPSLFLGMVFSEGLDLNLRSLFGKLKGKILPLVSFAVSFFLILLPYFIYRNPLQSSYLEEPAGRVYDLKTGLTYLLSLVFLFGFTLAFFYLLRGRGVKRFLGSSPGAFIFIILELVLILFWPAAIPRLFTAVIPLVLLPLADSISDFCADHSPIRFNDVLLMLVLLVVYIATQYFIRLQFLIIIRNLFILVVIFQLFIGFFSLKKKFNLLIGFLGASMLVWSLATVWVHKDIFRGVKESAVYALETGKGTIGYNDVSAVTPWYLGERGLYMDLMQKENLTEGVLGEKEIEYVLITNEHNPDLEIDLAKRPWLELEREYSYKIGGREFFTWVVKYKNFSQRKLSPL